MQTVIENWHRLEKRLSVSRKAFCVFLSKLNGENVTFSHFSKKVKTSSYNEQSLAEKVRSQSTKTYKLLIFPSNVNVIEICYSKPVPRTVDICFDSSDNSILKHGRSSDTNDNMSPFVSNF